jgi:PIN domain nuclease of toxin-antitoxin system
LKLLLDTHAFLWFITSDPQLSDAARALLVDPANTVLISPASYWEVAIKVSIGKHALAAPFHSFVTQGIFGNGFAILAIQPEHAALVSTLPFHHRDPFDRVLIAQALVEKVTIVSADGLFDSYGVQRIW